MKNRVSLLGAWGLCAAAGLGVGVAAQEANADFLQYQGVGTFQVIGPKPNGVEFGFSTPVVAQIGGFGFTGFSGTVIQTFSANPLDPDPIDGEGILVGATPGDTLMVEFHGLAFGTNPGSGAIGASASFFGGTGVYAGLSGDGDFSSWVILTSAFGGDTGLTLQGELVPAPGVPAALLASLGLAAARRRRR